MTLRRHSLLWVGGAVTLLFASFPAKADQSDIFQVFNGSSQLVCSATESEIENATTVVFIDPTKCGLPTGVDLFNAGQFGSYTQFTTLDPIKGLQASDVFGIANIGTSQNPIYVLGYTSDSEPDVASYAAFVNADCPTLCTITSLDEPGGSYNATVYLSTTLHDAYGWSASFTSQDVPGGSTVPEPSSLGGAFGLAALGLCAWKHRWNAA